MDQSKQKKHRVIVTGATGMVGEGVAYECLKCDQIDEVLLVNRRASHWTHPKLKEIIHEDLFHLEPIADQLRGYDACFFCLGTTSLGKSEKEYTRTTYELTLHFAQTLVKVNPSMTFCYISGSGTDATENGKIMWARVKGRTENALLQMGFKQAYNFRPGVLTPTQGLKNTLKYYHYLAWLLPIINKVFPRFISTLRELGQAMIGALVIGYDAKVLEVTDIKKLAAKYNAEA